MEAITLPLTSSIQNISQDQLITKNQTLVTSIQLNVSPHTEIAEVATVLNDMKQVERLTNMNERRYLLQLHGIPTSKDTFFLREYVLFLFQTEVLIIFRSQKQTAWLAKGQHRRSFQNVPLTSKEKEVRKIQALAIRALYALGLDYGLVKCGIAQGNKAVVIQVNPSPRVSTEMKQSFFKALKKYVTLLTQEKSPLHQIILGTDPEFIVKSPQGNLVIASKYLPYRGRIGCDAVWIGRNRSLKPLVEVRPDPTPDPRKLVIRIYENLLLVGKKMNAVSGKWLAGALPYPGYPLGGHIHFSGISPNFRMLRALDNYLSFPLIIVEDPKGIKRRPKYGFLGDYRVKDYGGFEYRTLPSWLVSPTLTKGILALAKCIVANYQYLPKDPLSEPDLQSAYYEGDKQKANEWLHQLWADIRNLKDYSHYRNYLEPFYHYLSSGKTWDESKDFRKVWRLPPFHQRK